MRKHVLIVFFLSKRDFGQLRRHFLTARENIKKKKNKKKIDFLTVF